MPFKKPVVEQSWITNGRKVSTFLQQITPNDRRKCDMDTRVYLSIAQRGHEAEAEHVNNVCICLSMKRSESNE